jgi:hypothetical protein
MLEKYLCNSKVRIDHEMLRFWGRAVPEKEKEHGSKPDIRQLLVENLKTQAVWRC